MKRATASVSTKDPKNSGVRQVVTREELTELRGLAEEVRVEDNVRHYLRDLVRATRSSPLLVLGAGPRAALHLLVAARWAAALSGRLFVTPDDVQRMLPDVLSHRLSLSPEAELDGLDAREVLSRVSSRIEVPR